MQSFARAVIDLGEHTTGTEPRSKHPITIVWLDKLNSLAGIQELGGEYTTKVFKAFDTVERLAGNR